jgi:cell division protein FtsQ
MNKSKIGPARAERTYLHFTLTVCVFVALYLISQNWKNQLVLQTVQVYDASILTDNEVKSLADIHTGSPLYGLSLSDISHRVRQSPFVKEAVVVRALPYDLTITVHERDPLALLATATSMLSVDENGIVLPLPLGRKNDLPLVTNISDQLSIGDTVRGNLMRAVRFLSEAEELGPALSASVAEVQLQGENLVAITTAYSFPVLIGKGNFERKLLYLHKFLTEIAGAGISDYNYVDLRFDGQIVLGTQSEGTRISESQVMNRTSVTVN